MKILAIRIKNLASLEGESEIDFTSEPLKSAGIFAITGPMGAGKSTLLDALCLALFAKTPRHLNARETGIELQDVGTTKISQGDIRGILSKGCADGFAEVEFEGVDGNSHKTRWAVKRARNRIDGSLQSDTLELTNLTTNTPYPDRRKTEILKEIERLVGLNFEQFTRSVLLAQGEFTAFLKADKDQKSSLLEKLTGTDIYSAISIQVYEKYREAEQEYKQLQAQMEGIELLSLEDQLKLKEQKDQLLQTRIAFEKEKIKLVDDMNWHTALIALTKTTAEAAHALAQFKRDKDAAQDRTSTFNLVENVQDAREIFTARATFTTQAEKTTAALETLQLSIDALDKDYADVAVTLTDAEADLSKNELAYKQAGPDIAAAKVLVTVIKEKNEQVILAVKDSVEANKMMDAHSLQLKDKVAQIDTINQKIADLKQWKETNETRKPIAENLSLIISKLDDAGVLLTQEKTAVTHINTCKQNLVKAGNDIEGFKQKVGEAAQSLDKLIVANNANQSAILPIAIDDIKATENLLLASISEIVPATSSWELLYTNQQEYDLIDKKLHSNKQETGSKKEAATLQNTNLQQAHTRQQQAEKILNQALLQTQEKVEDMRAQLTTGSPCPVCGSEHHPFAISHLVLDNVMDGLKKEDAACRETYNQLVATCSKLQTEIAILSTDCIDLEKDKAARAIKIEEQNKKWQSFTMKEGCQNSPAPERLAWLKNEEAKLRSELKIIQGQVAAYQDLKQTIDLEKTAIINCEKIAGIAKENLKDAERVHENLGQEKKRLELELNAVQQNMASITRQLDAYFIDKEWSSKWQIDAEIFVQKVKEFAIDWNSKITLLEKDVEGLKILQAELKGSQNQSQNLDATVNSTLAKLTSLQQALAELRQ